MVSVVLYSVKLRPVTGGRMEADWGDREIFLVILGLQ